MVAMTQISVPTKKPLEFVDITSDVERAVAESGVGEGVVLLRSRHTTAALTCTEGDPSIHEDCLEILREQLPVSRTYRHSMEGAENAVAHLAEMMVFGESTWRPSATASWISVPGSDSSSWSCSSLAPALWT